jgi:hypothetical protein
VVSSDVTTMVMKVPGAMVIGSEGEPEVTGTPSIVIVAPGWPAVEVMVVAVVSATLIAEARRRGLLPATTRGKARA